MLDKLKTAIVLLLIGAISGVLIFGTNELTADGIAQNRILKEQNYYLEILGLEEGTEITYDKNVLDGTLQEEVVIYDASQNVLGYIYKGTETNSYGDITVLVGVFPDGTVAKVIISASTNTPNYVNKIVKNYLSPFEGQATDNLSYDELTGASYTYGSVSKFVEAAGAYYQTNRGEAS